MKPGRPLPKARWALEYAAAWLWFRALGTLSPERASDVGGWLGRQIGPRLPVTRVARFNLQLVFPEMTPSERERIVRGMWDNLGRTAAEYPHLAAILDPQAGRLEIAGETDIEAIRAGKQAAIAWSGHLANWEVMAGAAARIAPRSLAIARDPNNPWIAAMIERKRAVAGGERVPKRIDAGRAVLRTVRAGGLVALLIDQKMSDGISVSFFGRQAMTSPTGAYMSLRTGVPLYPVQLARTGPARFRLTVHPPMQPPHDGDTDTRTAALTESCNRLLEQWIRDKPEDWLWAHRRWPKKLYRQTGID